MWNIQVILLLKVDCIEQQPAKQEKLTNIFYSFFPNEG